ncbi:hypothetical protein llap_22506 [Limosa lapponica baueri]|uniref:PLAT domain-containing protein n=1 Tax=Limosa lapponica baueri TaxID=1758121 RepID=A0A2I0T062_LIMLA|nr:hypothetical protein llap_22506 [Limosa lapponica baueri]
MFLRLQSVLHILLCSFIELALWSNIRSSFSHPPEAGKFCCTPAISGKARYPCVVLVVLPLRAVDHCLCSALQVDSYDVTVEEDLGEIQLIKIEKRKYWYQDDWYLKYITVKTPMGDYLEFPCYRWITDEKEIVLRDGRGESREKPDFLQNIQNSSTLPSPFPMYLPVFSSHCHSLSASWGMGFPWSCFLSTLLGWALAVELGILRSTCEEESLRWLVTPVLNLKAGPNAKFLSAPHLHCWKPF